MLHNHWLTHQLFSYQLTSTSYYVHLSVERGQYKLNINNMRTLADLGV